MRLTRDRATHHFTTRTSREGGARGGSRIGFGGGGGLGPSPRKHNTSCFAKAQNVFAFCAVFQISKLRLGHLPGNSTSLVTRPPPKKNHIHFEPQRVRHQSRPWCPTPPDPDPESVTKLLSRRRHAPVCGASPA